ncbi:MAG TPA: DnaJ domain-containing protein [Rhodocyclaceae bacterium]|nr:DnaJ domain-containing protein [Rhodocyclaceae bacterium]
MKSLYAILRVHPKCTGDEIDAAYRKLIGQFGPDGGADEDARARLVAIREAYHVLADPMTRMYYDQKLAADIGGARPQPVSEAPALVVEHNHSGHGLPLRHIVLVAAMVIGGMLIYNNQVKERERQRVEAAKAIADKALEIQQQQQAMAEAEQQARLERQERLDAANQEARQRYESQRALREAEIRKQILDRQDSLRQRQEAMERQQQERQAAAQHAQELRNAQVQAAREKAEAERLSNSRGPMSF